MITLSCRQSVSTQLAIELKPQSVSTARSSAAKAFLFCAIAMALSLVPVTRAVAQNGVAVVGPSTTSTPYACTSAGIQQAITDAVNLANGITQSVVDASNCTSMTGTAFNSQIYVGATPGNLNQRIKLILPANGTWTANFSDTTKFALMWGNGAMVYGGTGSGEGQPFTISAGSGSTLMAVCGNDGTYGQYYHAEGFSCSAGSGATIQYAVLLINGGYDESYVGHVTAASWGATTSRVVWIHASCCSATFEDINAEAGGTANTVPCVLGDLNGAIHVSKLSCVHPGTGQNAVQILQSGFSNSNGAGSTYRDVYMEEGSNQDTTTPYVAVIHGPYSYPFLAADLLDGFRSGVDVTGSTRCTIDIGTNTYGSTRVNIANLSLGAVSKCAINDHVNNLTIMGPATGSVIASYDMTPRYGITLGALTVGTLPSATSNPGAMFRVSDWQGGHEGQACLGGGTSTALAFSNGSVWKCF